MPKRDRVLMLTMGAALAIGAVFVAGVAEAGEDPERPDPSDQVILLQGDATVTAEQRVDNVIVGRGAVIVEGTVDGDVIVIDGTATVSGTVEGSVIVVRGTAEITDSGTVEGDVVGQKLEIDTGATIGGDQTDLGLSFDAVVDSVRESARALMDRLAFFFWLSSTVSYLLLGLVLVWLAPSALRRSVESARRLVGESIAWGVALLIVLPLVSVLLVLARVGFPFGVGLFLALFLAYAIGYVVAAAALGQAVLRRHDRLMVPFLLGWAILRLVALIPIAGIIIWALSAVYGLGAIAMAAQRAQSDADRNRAGVSLGT